MARSILQFENFGTHVELTTELLQANTGTEVRTSEEPISMDTEQWSVKATVDCVTEVYAGLWVRCMDYLVRSVVPNLVFLAWAVEAESLSQ